MGDCTTQFHMRNIIYIMINRCKDPNWTTSRMESIRGFFCGSIDLRTYIGSRTFQLAMSWFSVIFFLISGSSWVEQVQGVFSWTLLDAERPGFHGHVLALPCFTLFFRVEEVHVWQDILGFIGLFQHFSIYYVTQIIGRFGGTRMDKSRLSGCDLPLAGDEKCPTSRLKSLAAIEQRFGTMLISSSLGCPIHGFRRERWCYCIYIVH